MHYFVDNNDDDDEPKVYYIYLPIDKSMSRSDDKIQTCSENSVVKYIMELVISNFEFNPKSLFYDGK